MQLFTDSNFDFIGRQKVFMGLSLVLILAGLASWAARGGFKLGVDFKGGTLVYAKFQEAPNVESIRQALNSTGVDVATLQPFEGGEELKIDLNLQADETGGVSMAGRDQILNTLRGLYPGEEGKVDINNVGAEALATALRASSAANQLGYDQVTEVAVSLLAARDGAGEGLISSFEDLANAEGVTPEVMTALREKAYLGGFAIRSMDVVGPKIGGDLQWQALQATMAALGGMLLYIAFRFEWIYGLAAVVAVFHDVLITLGFFSIFDREIELTVVAALLTLVGYSMNDTIVIFDRVRENRKTARRVGLADLLNRSINQTLARTVLTSGLTFVAVLCLFIFGGEVLRGFSFALVVGVIVGSYSSIFVASPILLWWQGRSTAVAGRKA